MKSMREQLIAWQKRKINSQKVNSNETLTIYHTSVENQRVLELKKYRKIRKSENKPIEIQQQKTETLKNTQLQDITTKKEELYLCMGIDIGTSTTKVIIQHLYADDSFYVVDFQENGIVENTYLLPTEISQDNNANYVLSKKNACHTFDNLKVNFMKKQEQSTCYLRAFIANVIKYSQNWFINKYGSLDIFKEKEFIWQFNMGIPSASFNETGENERYKILLTEAYNLSQCNMISTISKISSKSPQHIELNIIPEIVATIQSYLKQNGTTPEGLYCAIDIGASTLDICTFKIQHDDDQDKYSFFYSKVEEFGAYKYRENMFSYLYKISELFNSKYSLLKNNPLVSENLDDYILTDEIKMHQESALKIFFDKCSQLIRTVIHQTKLRRDPFAKEWTSSFPIILCGGGSYLKRYNEMLDKINFEYFQNTQFFGEQKPQMTYVKLSSEPYISNIKVDPKRMLVAQGLSYPFIDFDNIKIYYKETEIVDIVKQVNHSYEDNYISKEQV